MARGGEEARLRQIGDLELVRALLDLVLERGVGFLQPHRHGVELVAQGFELVSGPDRNAVAEIAAADARRAGAQRLDRHDHPTRQREPARERRHQPGEQQRARARERGIERRERLGTRRFDEHEPADATDRCMGGQHRLAEQVDAVGDILRRRADAAAGGPDMGKPGHVRVLEHQTDVRMRDEAAARVDHVGVALPSHLDQRDDLPDPLQVHLGDRHPGVGPRPRDGDRHVRLGVVAEADRPVVDLVPARLDELLVAREIRAAVDDGRQPARQPEALAARQIDLHQLADGRRLLHQPEAVEFSLRHRIGGPRQLHRPAQLLFDRVDESFDPQGSRDRLRPLHAHQRVAELPIREPDVEQRAAEQNDADDREKQRHVLAEERPADLLPAEPSQRLAQDARPAPARRVRRPRWLAGHLGHSTTSSVTARNCAGTVRPRALAVLKLIASRNFVRRRIGRSAALAPLRMRPT